MDSFIVGVDEAGRGPLAGPVVVAAVKTTENLRIKGVKDSKKLSSSEREKLFDIIIKECLSYDIEIIDNSTIDEINILQATMSGMKKCLEKLQCLKDRIYIDGNYFRFTDGSHSKYNFRTVIGGDDKIFQISCASILAKVVRDRLITGIGTNFPEYNFFNNKGYPTKEHIQAIKKFGITEVHRKSFCRKYLTSSL